MLLKVLTVAVAVFGIGAYYYLDSFKFPLKTPKELNPQYDYIIVGGGSAGSVLAAKLSEDPAISVLLLEAGSDGSSFPWAYIPAVVPLLQQTPLDWAFRAEPQKLAAQATNGGVSFLPRGKVLGGSGVLNYLIQAWGTAADYDGWESRYGLLGWSWDYMRPFFSQLETALFPGASKDRGKAGPVNVEQTEETPLGQSFAKAVHQLGIPTTPDYNDGQAIGYSRAQVTVKRGWRHNSAEAFLRPASKRHNLAIVTGAHVTKVNVDESGRAVGVDYEWGAARRRVLVNYEIVLSAGAYGTPHLLLLSGIGPKDVLAQHKACPSDGQYACLTKCSEGYCCCSGNGKDFCRQYTCRIGIGEPYHNETCCDACGLEKNEEYVCVKNGTGWCDLEDRTCCREPTASRLCLPQRIKGWSYCLRGNRRWNTPDRTNICYQCGLNMKNGDFSCLHKTASCSEDQCCCSDADFCYPANHTCLAGSAVPYQNKACCAQCGLEASGELRCLSAEEAKTCPTVTDDTGITFCCNNSPDCAFKRLSLLSTAAHFSLPITTLFPFSFITLSIFHYSLLSFPFISF